MLLTVRARPRRCRALEVVCGCIRIWVTVGCGCGVLCVIAILDTCPRLATACSDKIVRCPAVDVASKGGTGRIIAGVLVNWVVVVVVNLVVVAAVCTVVAVETDDICVAERKRIIIQKENFDKFVVTGWSHSRLWCWWCISWC